jgi:hypothetical protein
VIQLDIDIRLRRDVIGRGDIRTADAQVQDAAMDDPVLAYVQADGTAPFDTFTPAVFHDRFPS